MLKCLLNVIDHCEYPESRTKLESVPGTVVRGIIVWEGWGWVALAGLFWVLCACVYLCCVCVRACTHTHPRPIVVLWVLTFMDLQREIASPQRRQHVE